MNHGLADAPLQSPNHLLSNYGQYFDSIADSSGSRPFPNMGSMILPPSSMHSELAPSDNECVPTKEPDQTGDKRDGKRRRLPPTSRSAQMRRQEQNRASQQAFQERKRRHVKGLETQLNTLLASYQKLHTSFTLQADIHKRLQSQFMELTAELNILRSTADQSFGNFSVPGDFEEFNAYSGHEVQHNLSMYFDLIAGDLDFDFDLNVYQASR